MKAAESTTSAKGPPLRQDCERHAPDVRALEDAHAQTPRKRRPTGSDHLFLVITAHVPS
jgi:hypothetical protein